MFVLVNLNCVGCRCHSIKLRPNCLFFFIFPLLDQRLSAWGRLNISVADKLQIQFPCRWLTANTKISKLGRARRPRPHKCSLKREYFDAFLPLVLKRSKLSRTHSCLCGLVKTLFWKRGSVLTSENADFIFHCFSLKIRENTEQIPVFKQKRISLCS